MRRVAIPVVLLAALVPVSSGCRITPEAIQVIETENELLREEIAQLKEKCDQSRELELRLDEEGSR